MAHRVVMAKETDDSVERFATMEKSAMQDSNLVADVERLQAERGVMDDKAASDCSDAMVSTEMLDRKLEEATDCF